MDRPHAYKARFLPLSAARYAWAHRRVTWVILLLPLPCMLLPWHPASFVLLPWLLSLPWALGGALGEMLSTAPAAMQTAGVSLTLLRPHLGRRVWLGMRYFFALAVAILKGSIASCVVALVYFVLSVATGFIDSSALAAVLNLLLQTLAAVTCTGLVGYFALRVVACMFMAPVWVARGHDVQAALLRSQQFTTGRMFHIASVIVWLNLLPCLAALCIMLVAPDVWQMRATGFDTAPWLAQVKMAAYVAYAAHGLLAPATAMAPALLERQELAWVMPPQTQIVVPAIVDYDGG